MHFAHKISIPVIAFLTFHIAFIFKNSIEFFSEIGWVNEISLKIGREFEEEVRWILTFTDPSVAELSLLLILLILLDELWLRVDFLLSFKTECCRSSTVGQIQIGGNRWTRLAPSLHSGLTWLAQRLCSWNECNIDTKLIAYWTK